MIWKRALLGLATLLFIFLTIRAINEHGYFGVILTFMANPATELLSVDLILSLSLVLIWLVQDARKNGHAYLPFVAITLLFGVAGPLLYLLLRDFPKRAQQVEGVAVLLALGAYAAAMHPLADLQQIETHSASQSSHITGRQLMEQAARAHGLEAWSTFKTTSVTARDRFNVKSWWPEQNQGLELHLLNGTFSSQVKLTDGVQQGKVGGLQAWTPYDWPEDSMQAVELVEGDPQLEFYLPSLHYFFELPFRLLSAGMLIHQGEARHAGQTYDLVLASWGEEQPNLDHDQYLVWINRQSGLIDMVRYTVRETSMFSNGLSKLLMRSLALGTIHYDDYRLVDGVQVPFAHTVTLPPPELTRYPLDKHFFHRLDISAVSFDAVPETILLSLESLQPAADRKPVRPVVGSSDPTS